MSRSQEFDEFYAVSYRRILGQLYAMNGDLAAAEDAAAEAFTRAWQRWGAVRRSDSPEAWVRTVAVRVEISTWRKNGNRLRAHRRSSSPPASDPSGLGPDHVALVQALRTLPDGQRRALVLHYFADAPVSVIAKELRAPEGTVKSWLVRGRQALGEQLGENLSEEGVMGGGRS
ncbi:RNA polymerase sigma24 factor [Kineosporia sp. NBRC 101677]|uniref:sigma-70 family RNA polymerase sigma factor n=1 Tax=Kineosporia sp. NBRC 101677 TaxID=3032197 RepID=UPI0024A23225|nr:sigma-70 family RNA polymerase sigma factor [Kineosporia sp. NBRC 101677]GLY16256.1 RNA polymerase sigma24 factor [Kineosporia sp. NBRC 101677]